MFITAYMSNFGCDFKGCTQNCLFMELLSILLLSLLGLLQMNDTTELAFVGDAMQHGPQLRAAATDDGSYEYAECFSLIESSVKAADFAVANLECPLGGKPYMGYPLFSAPDEFPYALSNAGFDLLLLANNHILDKGGNGVIRTLSILDAEGITHTGAYRNAVDRVERMPLIKNINGLEIAFLSYTYGTNTYDAASPVIIDRIKRDVIAEDVRKAKEKGAEVVCVCMHWGNEYEQLPNNNQSAFAEYLKSIGVDIVVGCHPHVVQPINVDFAASKGRGFAVVYSLGNFISNQNDINCRGGALVKVKMSRYDDIPVILGLSDELFFCQKPFNRKGNYKLIPRNMADSVRDDSKKAFERFMMNTETLLNKYNKNID